MPVILQTRLPDAQTGTPGLPGTGPCGAQDWLLMDEAYAPQMVYREALLAERREAVFYQSEAARPAAAELLSEALTLLPRFGFTLGADAVVCPDGRKVTLDRSQPLWTLAHLVQEDLCILQKRGDEHVLTAAALCFPANWRLADKIEQPLTGIHTPVDEYDAYLIDGVGSAYPIIRTHKLLNVLQPYTGLTPLVLFFPGEYDGQSLRLFGQLSDTPYYRAFRLVD